MEMNRQLSGLKATTVWHPSVIPFLCALTNIITLKLSFKDNRVLGYDYLSENSRKGCWIAYEYTKLQATMCKRVCFCMYSYFIALITNLLSPSFFYYSVPLRSVCSESPLEASWSRGGELTIISGDLIDINKEI